MELDKRIKKGKRPLNLFDTKVVEKYIGGECYFSNVLEDFINLQNTQKRTLKGVYTRQFRDTTDDFWYFCLPCEWVEEEKKEPKYRPYTIDTFLKKFKLGDSIILRYKGSDTYEELLFTGYSGENVHLGACVFGFNSLFNAYEFGIHYDEFVPFGVLEE